MSPFATLSVIEAAAALGVSEETVRRRLRDGTLQGERVAGRWQVYVPAGNGNSDAPSSSPAVTCCPRCQQPVKEGQARFPLGRFTWHKRCAEATLNTSAVALMAIRESEG